MPLQALAPVLSYDSDEECGTPSSSISDFSLGDFPQAEALIKSPPLVLGFDDSTLSTAFCDDVRREDVPEPPPKKRHPVYYFEDGSLEILAEDTHYNVHRSMIRRHAPSWLATLDRTPDAKTLADVSCEELDALLAIIYPASCARWGLASLEEWTAVLRLATLWSFATVRTLAVRELEPLASVIDKLVLARAHGVEQWLRPAFVELCLRPAKFDRTEAARLQARPDDVVLIFTVREEIKDSRLPREEAIVTERVDAWLTARAFKFPDPTTATRTLPPKAAIATIVSPDVRTACTDEPSGALAHTISTVPSSSTNSVGAASETLDHLVLETSECLHAHPASTRPVAPPTVETLLGPQVEVAPIAPPKESLILASRRACNSTKPERFDTVATLITTSNANEFTAFIVDRLTKSQPSQPGQWSGTGRRHLHRDCTHSLLRRAVRTPTFVPVCATVLSGIAGKLPEGVRDIPLGPGLSDEWTGPRLGRSRTREYLKPALLAWRGYLADGTQRKDPAGIINGVSTINDAKYSRRGERLESLRKALVANGLLTESDLEAEGETA